MNINFNTHLANKENYLSAMSFTAKEKPQVASFINTDRMVDSFISLAKIDSGSKEKIAMKKTPSTQGQVVLANILAQRLREMGLTNVDVDEHAFVTATLAGNIGENSPKIALLAHMDTSEDSPSKNVKPIIHDYKSGDLKLSKKSVISAQDLKNYVGQKIITSNGQTLLGADDKAGIAEIIEAINVFKEHPELKRPHIKIVFTPDEETGFGIAKCDIKKIGADFAYTVDGDLPNIVEDGSFNAFNPEIVIKGKNVHTGYAYKKMISANDLANEFMNSLPKNQRPVSTKGKQGYLHVTDIKGNVNKAKINMYVRDFDYEKVKSRVDFLKNVCKELEKKYPGSSVTLLPNERYRNMKEKLNEFPQVVEFAKKAIKRSGLKPKTVLIRGGTDGSRLSLKGLLTPNLGAGGHNFHSKMEFLPIEDMKKCTENILNLMMIWAENSKKIMPKILLRR